MNRTMSIQQGATLHSVRFTQYTFSQEPFPKGHYSLNRHFEILFCSPQLQRALIRVDRIRQNPPNHLPQTSLNRVLPPTHQIQMTKNNGHKVQLWRKYTNFVNNQDLDCMFFPLNNCGSCQQMTFMPWGSTEGYLGDKGCQYFISSENKSQLKCGRPTFSSPRWTELICSWNTTGLHAAIRQMWGKIKKHQCYSIKLIITFYKWTKRTL